MNNDPEDLSVHRRNAAGPSANKIAGVAIRFPYELLDIYLGAWAASCLPGMSEERLLPDVPQELRLPGFEDELQRRRSFTAPEGSKHLKNVLCLNEFHMDGSDPRIFSCPVDANSESYGAVPRANGAKLEGHFFIWEFPKIRGT